MYPKCWFALDMAILMRYIGKDFGIKEYLKFGILELEVAPSNYAIILVCSLALIFWC